MTILIRRRGVAHTLTVRLLVLGLANFKVITNVFTANFLRVALDNVPSNLQSGGARLKMMLVVSLCCPAAPFQVYAHAFLPIEFAIPTNYALPSASYPRSVRKA